MKKIVKHLKFEETETEGYTKRFNVYSNHDGCFLGCIRWRNGWRTYVMMFATECDWSIDCLKECEEFINNLLEERNR